MSYRIVFDTPWTRMAPPVAIAAGDGLGRGESDLGRHRVSQQLPGPSDFVV